MGLLLFMAITCIPLFVFAGILLWRQHQWDKYIEEHPEEADA